MDTVVMELEENPEYDSMNFSQRKSKEPNVGMVKQAAPRADDILLQHEVRTSKPENVSTDEHLESASSNTLDADEMSNWSLGIKLETVAQDSDKELSVTEELLHEELDIKSEDEATQETPLEEKHNLGNKLHTHRKHPCGVKPFKCNICDQSYRYKSTFKIHLRIHTEEKPFQCNICDYRFGQKSTLQTHLSTHTGEKPFKCNICDYSCGRKCNLNTHLRTHAKEKPFKCNICDCSFGRQGVLNVHLRTHTGEKPFQCNICDYSSGKKFNLNTHLRTHTEEKPFKCNICDFNFNHKSNLNSHLITHAGEKPFQCNICDCSCGRNCDFKIHLRTHTGEKPFKYNLCGYRSIDNGSLQKHLRIHSGEKPFKCNLCNYSCKVERKSLSNLLNNKIRLTGMRQRCIKKTLYSMPNFRNSLFLYQGSVIRERQLVII